MQSRLSRTHLEYAVLQYLALISRPAAAVPPPKLLIFSILMMVPWFKLHARNIEGFSRAGERTVIYLEGNTLIDIDWKNKTYHVNVDGMEIARDGSTFCPSDEERIAFYSVSQKELSAPLPARWAAANLTARALSAEGSGEIDVVVRDGKAVVMVPAQQPVIVYRGRGKHDE